MAPDRVYLQQSNLFFQKLFIYYKSNAIFFKLNSAKYTLWMGLTEIKGYKNEDPLLEGYLTDPKVLLLLLSKSDLQLKYLKDIIIRRN